MDVLFSVTDKLKSFGAGFDLKNSIEVETMCHFLETRGKNLEYLRLDYTGATADPQVPCHCHLIPPKKAQKMSLNAFLGDGGSWADEMDSLPTAPAARTGDDQGGDRRRDDFMSSRPDRSGPPREDLPLPTEPPYTAFVGNLAFDLTELDLEEFFGADKTKSVKIIRDREEKPKGFGYVEFTDLDSLKEALAKTGSSLAGRTIRVSVAEPPKERSGFGGSGGFDDDKFASNWRRDGPLPDAPNSRDGSRKRFDGPPSREPPPSTLADNASDWRSSRAPPRPSAAPPLESDQGDPSFKRRGSGFRSQEGAPSGAADAEESWTIGSKFKPSAPAEGGSPGSRFGSLRGRGDMGPPKEPSVTPDESDWRRPSAVSRNSTSPTSSTPPTPQLARRKLELLPRSAAGSTVPSPLSSPNPANHAGSSRSNPFGAAKPVDVSAKEALIAEKLEREREQTKERVVQVSMSRTSSRTATQRGPRSEAPPAPPAAATTPTSVPSSPKSEATKAAAPPPTVRPSFSFASAAAGKKTEGDVDADKDETEVLAEKIAEVQV
ncbi:hypothetical protein EUX98_g4722 [Antrodiella citrinella]|uniref:RRM domain-containing protein n=1 Tax=Antrodiella citrinella TaxID=2447956 RepID=A0A4V3XIK6_9APHY|nr:hypothetical protein EUX98_g4722 [Antrodiella citrinella]